MLTCVKDTNDFINKVKYLSVPKDAILVSLDFKSLYTNIPNVEGKATAGCWHEKYQQ